jgi:hypothetical protein
MRLAIAQRDLAVFIDQHRGVEKAAAVPLGETHRNSHTCFARRIAHGGERRSVDRFGHIADGVPRRKA